MLHTTSRSTFAWSVLKNGFLIAKQTKWETTTTDWNYEIAQNISVCALAVCVCVLHFAIQYFKFLSWSVLEMLSHSVNHFYRFFFWRYLNFASYLLVHFSVGCLTFRKKVHRKRVLWKQNVTEIGIRANEENIEILAIPFRATVSAHRQPASQTFMRFAAWKNDVVTLPAATSIKQNLFSTCFACKHGRSDFLHLNLVCTKKTVFALSVICTHRCDRWYDLCTFKR